MAKAITKIERLNPDPAEVQKEAIGRIQASLAEREEAVLQFLDIVHELHESGVLDLVQGLLKSRRKIGVLGMNIVNQQKTHRLIKNGINVIEFVGSLEPDKLKTLLNGVAGGVEQAIQSEESQQADSSFGIWGALRMLKDPEIGHSVATLSGFLKGMSRGMSDRSNTIH